MQDIDDLELLGRIWGFLKYYHPNIAKGEYNWDFELFRILPDYLTIKNSSERDDVLNKWIKKFGHLADCTTCKQIVNDAPLKPDLLWIDRSNMSNNLKDVLKGIYNKRNQGEHYYISLHTGVGNPNFKNEHLYYEMPYPDAGFRLLALYKYWNMIQYFFPYKNLTDQDWNLILKKYIPVFVGSKNELAYELAITRLIGEVNDSHAYVISGNDKLQFLRGDKFAPFKVEFVEDKLVVTEAYKLDQLKKYKLKAGDIITHINGKTVESIVDSLRPYYGASNEVSMKSAISNDLLRSSKDRIDIGFISSGQNHQTKLNLYNYKDSGMEAWYQEKEKNKKPTYRLLADSVGYFTLENVKYADVSKLKDTLTSLKGIVIDIRNYPNQFVTLQLASLFVSNHTDFAKLSIGNINNPGEFRFRQGTIIEPQKGKYKYQNKSRKEFAGKLIVLVNENSISQSEYTAMALRSVPNSMIIGSTTAGADGDVSNIQLPGGIKTRISGIGVYYPDGRETQRIGIVPDVVVKPTIEGVKAGKDEVLEKAIEVLKN